MMIEFMLPRDEVVIPFVEITHDTCIAYYHLIRVPL